MMRWLKLLAGIIGSLIVLVVVAVVVLPMIVDPNAYRDTIERQVAKRTGRDLRIDGPLELAVFPWLGLETGTMRLAGPEGFGDKSLARIQGADVRLRILPLLVGRISVGTVVLEGLDLRLVRSATGQINWAPPKGQGTSSPQPTEGGGSGAARPSGGSGGPVLGALTVGGLRVADARVTYIDKQAGTRYRLRNGALSSGAIEAGEAFAVEAGFDFASDEPAVEGRLDLEALVTVESGLTGVAVRDAEVRVDARGRVVRGGPLTARLFADAAWDGQAGTARLEDVAVEAAGSRLTGQVTAEGLTQEPRLDGSLKWTVTDGGATAERLAAVGGPVWSGSHLQGGYLRTDFTADLGQERAALEGIKGWLAGLRLTGEARARALTNGAELGGSLDVRLPAPATLVAPFDDQLPPWLRAEGLKGGRLRTEWAADAGAGAVRLEGLELRLGQAKISGSAEAEGLYRTPKVQGELASNPVPLRGLLKRLGVPLPSGLDEDVLQRAGFDLAFRGTPERYAVSDLWVRLDDSELTGSASLARPRAPQVAFDLDLNGIDLDRYLPAVDRGTGAQHAGASGQGQAQTASQSGEGGAPAHSGTAASSGALPVAALRDVAVDGQLAVGRLRVRGVRMQDLSAGLVGSEGRFRLHPLAAQLYGGRYSGDVRLDVTGDQPVVTLDEALAGVQVGELLNDMTGRAYLSGSGGLALAGEASGATVAELLKGLTGEGRLSLRDGALLGLNLERVIRLAVGEGDGAADGAARTHFRELEASFTVDSGRITSDDIRASVAGLAVRGEGTLDPWQQVLDSQLQVRVPADAGGRLAGSRIPVRIQGPVTGPEVSVDLGAVVKDQLGEVIQDQLKKEGGDGNEQGGAGQKSGDDALEEGVKERVRELLQ